MKAPDQRTVTGWIAENAVVTLTIVGSVFYVGLRLTHETFYSRLGLTPEDVGLGSGDAVARATGIAFYFVVGLTIGVAIPALIAIRLFPAKGHPQGPSLFRPIVALLAAAVVVGGFITTWQAAGHYVDLVQDGKRVRPIFFVDTGIRAEKAGITWVGDPPRGLEETPTHRLMFLGEAGGAVVLYDVDRQRSLRIPSSDVAVSIKP